MKKTIAILGTLIYLLTSTGVFANIHYCHSSISDIALFTEAESCCKKETKPCCNDESLLIKYENNSQLTSAYKVKIDLSFITIPNTVLITEEPTLESQNSIIDFESPPPKNLTSLYCNYTFYG